MTERDRGEIEPGESDPAGRGSGPEADAASPPEDYEGPGAWGPAALWLLGGLFVLSAAATVHSILVTFGG